MSLADPVGNKGPHHNSPAPSHPTPFLLKLSQEWLLDVYQTWWFKMFLCLSPPKFVDPLLDVYGMLWWHYCYVFSIVLRLVRTRVRLRKPSRWWWIYSARLRTDSSWVTSRDTPEISVSWAQYSDTWVSMSIILINQYSLRFECDLPAIDLDWGTSVMIFSFIINVI